MLGRRNSTRFDHIEGESAESMKPIDLKNNEKTQTDLKKLRLRILKEDWAMLNEEYDTVMLPHSEERFVDHNLLSPAEDTDFLLGTRFNLEDDLFLHPY